MTDVVINAAGVILCVTVSEAKRNLRILTTTYESPAWGDIIFQTSSIMPPHAGLTGEALISRKFRYAAHTVMHDAATAWLFHLQIYPPSFRFI